MWCAAGIYNYLSHLCAKGLLESNFDNTVRPIDKISHFQEFAPNFTYS